MHLIEPVGIGVYRCKSWEGDEGILPQFNPKFNLTDDRMARLSAKFLEFQTDRRTIHALLGDYAADYRRFKGSELARQEYLRERYASRAPQLSHLVWDDEDGLYWGPADIAILLNRDRSAVSRTLAKMAADEEWHGCPCSAETSAGVRSTPLYAYRQEIFDLIVDYYEEDYLRRFIRPRRGRPLLDAGKLTESTDDRDGHRVLYGQNTDKTSRDMLKTAPGSAGGSKRLGKRAASLKKALFVLYALRAEATPGRSIQPAAPQVQPRLPSNVSAALRLTIFLQSWLDCVVAKLFVFCTCGPPGLRTRTSQYALKRYPSSVSR